jgi:hypothetical protein
MTFSQYLTNFEYDKSQHPTLNCHGQDDLGNFIYKNKKITRFTTIPHTTQKKYYNILLQNVSFQIENELFFASNFEKSYVCDYYIHQFLPSLDNLQTYLMKYTHINQMKWSLFPNLRNTYLTTHFHHVIK